MDDRDRVDRIADRMGNRMSGKLLGITRGIKPRSPWKRRMPKVGRNEPCPCGSGKKFKKCCLKDAPLKTLGPLRGGQR
jgi:preprotein translocase subunit SecA